MLFGQKQAHTVMMGLTMYLDTKIIATELPIHDSVLIVARRMSRLN